MPQGWFADPFQRHDARWFSDGRPTALVRDGAVESSDPPPAGDMPKPVLQPTSHQAIVPTRRGFWGNLLDFILSIPTPWF